MQQNRREVQALFEQRAKVTRNLFATTADRPTHSEFSARADEVSALTERQQQISERFQLFARCKHEIEARLREPGVAGPWGDTPPASTP